MGRCPPTHPEPGRAIPAERKPMRIYTIIEDAGRIASVMAKSRTEAINKFLAETGMTREFFKKHCIVKAIR